MDINDLDQLRIDIGNFYGLQSRIAKAAGVSSTLVGLVLRGQRENERVLLLAADMLRIQKEAAARKQQRINARIKKAIK